MTDHLTPPDIIRLIASQDAGTDYESAVWRLIDKVHARDDVVCVYRNEDMGHRDLGAIQWTSYGSEASVLVESEFPSGPPTVLPDFGGAINWRYQLVGIYTPDALANDADAREGT